jgi:hypothetical protein
VAGKHLFRASDGGGRHPRIPGRPDGPDGRVRPTAVNVLPPVVPIRDDQAVIVEGDAYRVVDSP